MQGFDSILHVSLLWATDFCVDQWYAEQCAYNSELPNPWEVAQQWSINRMLPIPSGEEPVGMESTSGNVNDSVISMELGGVQVDCKKNPSLQQSAAQVKYSPQILPKPIVVKVNVNGHPV